MEEQIDNAVAAALASELDPPANYFERLFEPPHFEPTENPRKYRNRDGSSSTTIASVILPLRGCHVAVGGTISLQHSGRKGTAPVAVFRFRGSQFKPLDDAANTELVAYRRWIVGQFSAKKNGTVNVGLNASGVPIKVDGWTDEDDE